MKRLLVLSFLLSLALLAPASDAATHWTQTTRQVGSESIVTNATEFAIDTDADVRTVDGSFVSTASADTAVTGVVGSSVSQQSTGLTATSFSGTGSFDTMTDVTDPEGFADVFGRSIFTGYFDVDEPTLYALSGFVTSGGAGSAQILLHGSGGALVNEQPAGGVTIPFDFSGTLEPGPYLLHVIAGGNAQDRPPDVLTTASGEWEVSFVLGSATAVPSAVPAGVPAGGLRVFPNPARGSSTIALAAPTARPLPVRVVDAAGRLVRSLEMRGSVVWDTRDADGRPVPAGVYFATVQRDDRLETGRVTVLR